MYKIETKNGVVLESPSIRDIMDVLADMEYDTAEKFYFTKDEITHEADNAIELFAKGGQAE